MSHRHAIALAAIAGALSVGATPAAAKTLQVDDDHAQCPKAAFTSVQAAVTAAQPGDKVQVCPGTYTEQVRISSKPGLKLEAQKKGEATIKFPPTTTPPNALVHIVNSDDVDVRGFVITGPYTSGGCVAGPNVHRGVFVDNSDEAKIVENHITMIRDINPALYGCQDGISVQVGRQAESSVGDATVSHNLIDEYQKAGVVVDNAGSDGDVDHNQITAATVVQPFVAPNGVQVSRGAEGHVDHNEISENSFAPFTFVGSGILLFQPSSNVKVDHNELFANDEGIALVTATGTEISENDAHDNHDDGLFADSDTSDNLFKGNQAFGNTTFDCQDLSTGTGTAGTANTWKNDRGVTSDPPGICEPK